MRALLLSFFIFFLINSSFAQDEQPCQFEVSKKSQKLYKKAKDKLKDGNYSTATKLLKEAIEECPENLKALWTLAEINRKSMYRMRKEDLAIATYHSIVELCPSHRSFYSYYHLGVMYYERQKWESSTKYLKLFLESDGEKIHEKHFDDAVDLEKYARFYSQIYSKPVPFDPFKVTEVSSINDEYLPSLSPDNQYLYFTRRYQKSKNPRISLNTNTRTEKFCIAKKSKTTEFNIGSEMDYPFNEQSNEGGASLTINNKELFYTRCKIVDKALNCDICYSKYEDEFWSEIQTLSSNINTSEYWESMPSISSDGKTLYFVSNRPGGYGGYDIYTSTKGKDGKWQKAKNMGPKVNTAGHEKSPFIHTDRQTLYFSSSDRKDEETGEWYAGHIGLGKYDIFYTRLNDSTNEWCAPINIGYPINSKDNDLGFFVSTDGKYGYFASNKIESRNDSTPEDIYENKKQEPWNIYAFELYEEARPQQVLLMKGTLKDDDTEEPMLDASIELKNIKTKQINKIPIDSTNGEYAFALVMKSDYTMTVKKPNYAYITKYIGKNDVKFNTPTDMDMHLKQIEIGKVYNLEDIFFDTDSDQLTEASKKVVEGFYDFLIDNPNIVVELQGHTDNVGTTIYNINLSKARAKAVYDLLLEMGIPEAQMRHKGYGESQPIADNDTESGRARNRRTVFLIIKK